MVPSLMSMPWIVSLTIFELVTELLGMDIPPAWATPRPPETTTAVITVAPTTDRGSGPTVRMMD